MFKPRPVGGETLLTLKPEGIEIMKGLRAVLFRYDEIRSIRIAFRPSSMLNKRVVVFVTDKNGKHLKFFNTTYRGMAEMIYKNDVFIPFLQDFHEKLMPFKANISFTSGEPAYRYYAVILIGLFLGVMGLNAIFGASVGQKWYVFAALIAIYGYMMAVMWKWVQFNRPLRYECPSLPAFVSA